MVTIIREQGTTTDSEGNALGIVVGIILAIAFFFVLIVYGIPALRGNTSAVDTRQNEPGTNINVPGQIDVNLNDGGQGGTGGTPGSSGSGSTQGRGEVQY